MLTASCSFMARLPANVRLTAPLSMCSLRASSRWLTPRSARIVSKNRLLVRCCIDCTVAWMALPLSRVFLPLM